MIAVIAAGLLAGLLVMFYPDTTMPEDPPFRLANYRCADAIQSVEIVRGPTGSKFEVHFETGRESCNEEITDIQPIIHEGKRCVIFWFRTDHAAYCLPDSGADNSLPGIGI